MADHLTDTMDGFHPSPLSIMNHIPQVKRFDKSVARAAVAEMPEQGEQTGGYTAEYAHFAHIPLFPLYSEKQQTMLAKQMAHKEHHVRHMNLNDPDKQFSSGQKAFLSILGHASGGANIVSLKRFERRLIGANVMSTQKMMEQLKLCTVTRWTVPDGIRADLGLPVWFVDVLEHRFIESNYKLTSGNAVLLKIGIPSGMSGGGKKEGRITLKLLKTEAKGIKSQKVWKKGLNYEHCDAIAFVPDGGVGEVQMEIVARIQRACSNIEMIELMKRFDKNWNVPVI